MDTAWTPHATRVEEPVIRHIATADVLEALRLGWRDFKANPTQLIFLAVLYPIIGLLVARAMAGGAVMPLIWPLVSGFALVGPFAALGIYELSRRQEQGLPVSWYHGLEVRHSPALWSILVLGMLLVGIFLAWLVVAQFLYGITLGAVRDVLPPAGFRALVAQVFSTPEGLKLLVLGTGAGLLLAVLVLVLTVVSFPLLLDRGASGRIVHVGTAIRASVRAVTANPGPMALWGLIVAALLALGSLPLFVGLAVVLPVLGHATWHLYRKVVAD